jgi:hypothetical protein
MASRILASASSRVLPCETHPGSTGHSATSQPSSPGRRTTGSVVMMDDNSVVAGMRAGGQSDGSRNVRQPGSRLHKADGQPSSDERRRSNRAISCSERRCSRSSRTLPPSPCAVTMVARGSRWRTVSRETSARAPAPSQLDRAPDCEADESMEQAAMPAASVQLRSRAGCSEADWFRISSDSV